MTELQRCQTLLEEIEGLAGDQALERIEAFHRGHSFEAKPVSEAWILGQDIRLREGQLALDCGRLQHCVEALRLCEWRDADEVEVEAVRRHLAAGEGLGQQSQVTRIKSGGYEVIAFEGDTVRVARLSPEMSSEMSTGPIPRAAYQELVELRDLPASDKVRWAELFAKTAVKLHAGGRSEAALGLLELALARGLEHRALVPSRQALLDKGFTPDPAIEDWCKLFREDLGSGRGRPRISPEEGVRKELQALRSAIPSAYDWPKSSSAQMLLSASDSLLEKVVNGKLLAFLAVYAPERARALLASYEGAICQDVVGAYLAYGDSAGALKATSQLPLAQRFKTLVTLASGKTLTRFDLKSSDPAAFRQASVDVARQFALDPLCPDTDAPLAWLAKHDTDFEAWRETHAASLPGESSRSEAVSPMTQAQFEAEFGPRAPWPCSSTDDIVAQVNRARQLAEGERPFLDGSLTTWDGSAPSPKRSRIGGPEERPGVWPSSSKAWPLWEACSARRTETFAMLRSPRAGRGRQGWMASRRRWDGAMTSWPRCGLWTSTMSSSSKSSVANLSHRPNG